MASHVLHRSCLSMALGAVAMSAMCAVPAMAGEANLPVGAGVVTVGHDTVSFPEIVGGRQVTRRCVVAPGQAGIVGGHDERFGTYVLLDRVANETAPFCPSNAGVFVEDDYRYLWRVADPAIADRRASPAVDLSSFGTSDPDWGFVEGAVPGPSFATGLGLDRP